MPSSAPHSAFAPAGAAISAHTAQGTGQTCFASSMTDERQPSSPLPAAAYKNPSASRAILPMRPRDAGVTTEMRLTPQARQGAANSSFSSKGTSVSTSPETPASAQAAAKRSMP